MTLDNLALKHGTDKSSLGHNYCPLYEKHLPPKVNKFLEIGCYKGFGIMTFKEWYNNEGAFYAMDRFLTGHGLVSVEKLQADGINAYIGDHDEFWFLEGIKEQFTVIVEDGSHHWLSQLNIFRRMFVNNIEPGGWYVVEDTFDDSYWGQGIIKDAQQNIKNIFKRYKETGIFQSDIITQQEADVLLPTIGDMHIYDEILFINKKK